MRIGRLIVKVLRALRMEMRRGSSLLLIIHHEVRQIMTQLDVLTSDVAALQIAANQLISGYDNVSAQLAALVAAGGASPQDLSAVITSVEKITADVSADLARNAPAVPPAPVA